MEKICIVKLRKKPFCAAQKQDAGSDRGNDSWNPGRAETAVSLALTPFQAGILSRNPEVTSFLRGEFDGSLKEAQGRAERIIIKFELEEALPTKLVKSKEVTRMLAISDSYLGKLVKKGSIKSYKIGHLRRFMLGDVFSFLESSLDRREVELCAQRDDRPAGQVSPSNSHFAEEVKHVL